jgi:hypothetical protein
MIMRRIEGLLEDDQQIICELQPHNRGSLDLAHADPLWLHHRMNVLDKHRRMHLVSTALYDAVPFIAPGYTIADLVVTEGTKAGDEILRFRATKTDPKATEPDSNPNVNAVIKFGPGSGDLTGRSVRSELPNTWTNVRDQVFPRFQDRVGPLRPVGDVHVFEL